MGNNINVQNDYSRGHGRSVHSWLYLFREAYHFIESGTDRNTTTGIGTTLLGYPFSLTYSGNIVQNKGTYDVQGVQGLLWTAWHNSASTATYLEFRDALVYTRTSNSKKYGWPVRL